MPGLAFLRYMMIGIDQGAVMVQRVRFTHKLLPSGQHAILSPDIRGFFVVGAPGDSRWDVEKQALDVLILLQERDAAIPRGLPAMELEAA